MTADPREECLVGRARPGRGIGTSLAYPGWQPSEAAPPSSPEPLAWRPRAAMNKALASWVSHSFPGPQGTPSGLVSSQAALGSQRASRSQEPSGKGTLPGECSLQAWPFSCQTATCVARGKSRGQPVQPKPLSLPPPNNKQAPKWLGPGGQDPWEAGPREHS